MLDRERMPRYPGANSDNDYEIIEKLISNGGAKCAERTLNGGVDHCDLRFPSLAMMYSPNQEFENLYEPESGLCRGTIFKELDLPFCGRTISR